jgi:hypothetical protein
MQSSTVCIHNDIDCHVIRVQLLITLMYRPTGPDGTVMQPRISTCSREKIQRQAAVAACDPGGVTTRLVAFEAQIRVLY